MNFSDIEPFLRDHRLGVLATIRSSGLPQMSNVAYGVLDGQIWVSVTDGRAKTANVRSDPRAVLHVTREDFRQYAIVEGDVSLTPVASEPDDTTVADLITLYREVGGEHPDWAEFATAMVGERRLVLKLAPTHVYGNVG